MERRPWSRVRRVLRRRPRPGSGDFAWDLADYTGGNRLALYVRGEDLYPAMAEAMEDAKSSISLETYILGGDKTGRTFAELLAKKSREGARARLIYDSVGSLGLDPAVVTRLRNAGVEVLEYHPVAPWRPRWAWNRRDHRKILVCDGRVGFAGGMNLCDEHAPSELGGQDWLDAHARVEGPAAFELERLFRATWYAHTGRWFALDGACPPVPGGAKVRIVGNREFLRRLEIRAAYVAALRAAREEVFIANSYFVPGWRIRSALAQAAARGVDARVLVPGKPDVRAAWHAMRSRYDDLLSRGVRVFEWQGAMLHAKAVVVDGLWSAVGSYNLDHRSLQHNLEVNLHSLDRAFAAELRARFERSLQGAREITLQDWRRRPWADRLLERVCASFDYFL
ncbi:MAG: cardiolipin synthase B [Elusimicrobia bacterium]|nr:cardiolipin synthase B [Elusimicrobiota bacterium]